MRVYVTGHDDMIGRFFEKYLGYEAVYDRMEHHDILCLSGGGDISPALYGQDNDHSQGILVGRDLDEIKEYFHALMKRIPIIGICRGAQLLWALNGGILHQHRIQTGYESDGLHPMRRMDDENAFDLGDPLYINSTHHQMMALLPYSGIISNVWVSTHTDPFRKPGSDAPETEHHVEMFAVHSKKILAMQFHPEYKRFPEDTRNKVIEDIKRTCADFAES